MKHIVNDIDKLYDDVSSLNQYCMVSSGSNFSMCYILELLKSSIDELSNNWKGPAAIVNINKLIDRYNSLFQLKDALGILISNSSKIASGYRELLISLGVNAQSLGLISYQSNLSSILDVLSDDELSVSGSSDERIIVSGTIVQESLNKIKSIINRFDDFNSKLTSLYEEIANNWQAGAGYDAAVSEYDKFKNEVAQYKETFQNVSDEIQAVLDNYN